MQRILLFLLLSLLVTVRLTAQIYADISLAEGGTSLGSIRVQLHHQAAPRTVANFIGLATGERAWISPTTGAVQSGVPYYDGLSFHRLIHDFMIQGGDPLGTGASGPGYVFQDEFDPSLRHNGSYVVSMANSGVNSNGSQFFITLEDSSHLDDLHTVFGIVIDDASVPGSRAVIDAFKSSDNFPTDSSDRPLTPISIESVSFSGPDLASFDIHDPALGLPTVHGIKLRLRHDVENSQFFLQWSRQHKWDYPLYYGNDLESWTRVTNILSMGNDSAAEVELTNLFAGDRGFVTMAGVDYSHTPDLPADIFSAGDTLVMAVEGGTLTLTFDGAGAGTWSFEDTDAIVTTGAITQYYRPNTSTLYGIPTSGIFTSPNYYTYARSLAAREVVVFFDGPVGPYGITAIQAQLSFHSDSSGWYNGPVNADETLTSPFRGTFTWAPGP
ncbi:peptidylprolyl isomerase [Coraliomargarita sp. SDUM461004]|uniref:peptidylprolyl isomerase n=1 Tax=Thalassobacterium sedimentorum TaxID=3041258 RepID=A0ABU1ANH4_9BACT|nr:peptidylprolyl isomerase [Coraliomargarita sp. SDUM461004]MDQ8196351.1 peptidylprolyl isomerase [Coraliomargarita sp. SDUM461004]